MRYARLRHPTPSATAMPQGHAQLRLHRQPAVCPADLALRRTHRHQFHKFRLPAHCLLWCPVTHANVVSLTDVALQVETAYDVLLMQSMKRRIGGTVDSSVRFADVAKARPAQQVQPLSFALAISCLSGSSNGGCACHLLLTCLSLELQACCGPPSWLPDVRSGHACQACPAVWRHTGSTVAGASTGTHQKHPCAPLGVCTTHRRGPGHLVIEPASEMRWVQQAQPNALQQFLNYSPAPQQALVRQSAAFSFLALLALIQVSQGPWLSIIRAQDAEVKARGAANLRVWEGESGDPGSGQAAQVLGSVRQGFGIQGVRIFIPGPKRGEVQRVRHCDTLLRL